MLGNVDFGYPWWLSYGHLPIVAGSGLVFAFAYVRKWPKWALVLAGLVLLWSTAAFVAARFVLDINGRGSLPTESFMRSGTGRVLDMGAGTGRSSIMVLEARPQTTLVALDLFGQSFDQHFGHGETPQQKLLRNLKAAGVEQRVTLQTADMRAIPFPSDSFDAVVSAYAIDHLNRDGIHQSLAEADRVLKPGGDFLLMLVGKEPWVRFMYGPLLHHLGTHGAPWWTEQLQQAGFHIVEEGTRPATLYILARRSAGPPQCCTGATSSQAQLGQ